MNFDLYFKSASYCMIGAAFAAIAATGRVGPTAVLLFAAVFIASLAMRAAGARKHPPVWIQNSLCIGYLVFFFYDLRTLSQSLLGAAIHLLLFIAALKLLTLARDRDHVQLYLIGFALILAASTLTVNIVFAVCLLVFLFCGINALILLEMRRSYAKTQEEAIVRPLVPRGHAGGNRLEVFSPFPSGIFAVTTFGITLLVVTLAVPFFFVFPRITRGFYRQPSGDTQFISGFSDRVELGQIGSIKQSAAVVMRVKTGESPEEMPPDLKWRGIAFDYFDGRSWTRTNRNQSSIPTQGPYYKLETSTQGTRWLNQTFFIEALPTNVVFAARKALAVSRDVGSLRKDFADSLYTDRYPSRKLRYSVLSDPIRPDPALISDRLPVPPQIRATYLHLLSDDPRVADLAKRVTEGASNRYAKAQALQEFLRSNYEYSLVLRGIPNSKDPIAMFLFDVRKGHCEYFASAMAIMLRHLGIPSRLVNGFRTGEYNRLGNNWIVRQYDAHSWVEAYFPPYGWVEFDPTPTEFRGVQSGFARMISNLRDALDLWWWEEIINYDASKQFGMIRTLYSGLERGRDRAGQFVAGAFNKGRDGISRVQSGEFLAAVGKKWFWALPVLPLAAAALVGRWRRRFCGWIYRSWHRGNSRVAAASFYREALALLGDQGFLLDHGQTPLEFALSLGPHPARTPFLALTKMYNSIRFGPPDQELDYAAARAQLRSLRDSLRTSHHNPGAGHP